MGLQVAHTIVWGEPTLSIFSKTGIFYTVKMTAVISFETLVPTHKITRRHIAEHLSVDSHRSDNVKSHCNNRVFNIPVPSHLMLKGWLKLESTVPGAWSPVRLNLLQ